jgi:hypothetical protein
MPLCYDDRNSSIDLESHTRPQLTTFPVVRVTFSGLSVPRENYRSRVREIVSPAVALMARSGNVATRQIPLTF